MRTPIRTPSDRSHSRLLPLCAIALSVVLSGCAWLPWGRTATPPAAVIPAAVSTASTHASANSAAIGDNSRNALDWPGTYEGVTPCADCAGIRTRLTLNADLSYSLSREYLDRNPIAFVDSGNFSWAAAGDRIFLDAANDGPNAFLVGENRLFQLDLDGNRITGALAERYILEKREGADNSAGAQLVGRRWLLQELGGRRLAPAANPAAQVFLQFNAGSSTIHGFAGCNSFSGGYALDGPTRLRFGDIASTLRACLDDDANARERELLRMLDEVDSYAIADGRLSLHRARMAPLAVFSAD